MARPVCHIGDQVPAGCVGRAQLVHQVADALDNFQIGALIETADIVFLSQLPLFRDQHEGAGMVVHIQPVTDVLAGAVDRQRQPVQRIQDHQRDQFLRKLVGPVIVRTVGDDHRQAIGPLPRRGEVVGGRLAGRVRRGWIVRRRFLEETGLAQRAVHFIGRDMQEAERILGRPAKAVPIGTRRLQKTVGAHNIGLDKGLRTRDRAVNMAFRGKVQHPVRLLCRHDIGHRGLVADIELQQLVTRAGGDLCQRLQVRRISQLVDHHDVVIGIGMQPAHKCRSDKASAAGDYGFHIVNPFLSAGDGGYILKRTGRSFKRGCFLSLSEMVISSTGTGQSMPISGSLNRTPPSSGAE